MMGGSRKRTEASKRVLHCWEGSQDDEGNTGTCMLPRDHVEPHSFTPDKDIVISFAPAEEAS